MLLSEGAATAPMPKKPPTSVSVFSVQDILFSSVLGVRQRESVVFKQKTHIKKNSLQISQETCFDEASSASACRGGSKVDCLGVEKMVFELSVVSHIQTN